MKGIQKKAAYLLECAVLWFTNKKKAYAHVIHIRYKTTKECTAIAVLSLRTVLFDFHQETPTDADLITMYARGV